MANQSQYVPTNWVTTSKKNIEKHTNWQIGYSPTLITVPGYTKKLN